jgi:predicted metalloprotease
MQWRGRRESDNLEDMRGQRVARGGMVGIGGTGLVIVVLLALLTGQNPLDLLSQITAQQQGGPVAANDPDAQPQRESATDREQREFVAVVLADTEDVWNATFRDDLKRGYQEPRLVLFSGGIESGCGFAQAAVGPFYCPADRKVYLDLSFFRELDQRFGAPGDFAQAYVVAHEVGHHVQNLMGISEAVSAQRERADDRQSNALSVRLELQADCYAGIWGHYAQSRGLLEPGDADEGLNAAAAIGDDRLQRMSRGEVIPETFTHGSSAERVRWLRRGLDGGTIESCDTFQTGTH